MTKTTLVLGTGKTGRRIVQRLTARGLPVRAGSRSERALGRRRRDFSEYARDAAATGIWNR